MIKKPFFLLSALCLALLLAPTSQAAKFYKWVDSQGVTHYGQNPPDTETASEVNVKTGASSDQKQAIEQLEERREAAEAARQTPEEKESEVEAKNREIMKNNCKIQRQNLAQLKANRRIKETDADGKVRYLDEEDIKKRVQEVQKYIEDNCKDF